MKGFFEKMKNFLIKLFIFLYIHQGEFLCPSKCVKIDAHKKRVGVIFNFHFFVLQSIQVC